MPGTRGGWAWSKRVLLITGKDSDAGRDWGQEEKGMTEDEMAGWHHWLDGCEFGYTPGIGEGPGRLACYNSWGRKESDVTEWLNWTESIGIVKWNSLLPTQWTRNVTAISDSGLQMWMQAPKAQSSRCHHPPWWLLRPWGNTRRSHWQQPPLLKVNKETGFGPDSWGTYESNEFREPRGLNLPIHPMLKSLIRYLIFDAQPACSLCCTFVCSLTPTAIFQGEHFAQSYWDAVSWAWSPKLPTK